MFDHSLQFSRAAHVVSTTHNGEAVLLDAARGQYHALNAVSTRVWELLSEPTTSDTIVDSLSQEFRLPDGAAPDQIRQDVTVLLAEMERLGVVTVQAGQSER